MPCACLAIYACSWSVEYLDILYLLYLLRSMKYPCWRGVSLLRYHVNGLLCSIAGLQNDFKDVMKRIEEKLYQIHDCARKTRSVSSGYTSNEQSASASLKPFLTVNDLASGGPADHAVIYVIILIIKIFCSIQNHSFMQSSSIFSSA